MTDNFEKKVAVDGPVVNAGELGSSTFSPGQALPAGPLGLGQRWTVARKREVVLRLLRDEPVQLLSRQLGVEIFRLEQWRFNRTLKEQIIHGRIYRNIAELRDGAQQLKIRLARLLPGAAGLCVLRHRQARGRLAFLDELNKMPGRDRIRSDFLATMLFGDLLSPSQLDDVVEAKLAEYRSELTEMEACDMTGATAGHAFVHGFGISFYRAAIAYMEDHSHTVVGGSFLSTPAANSLSEDATSRPQPVTPREAAE